MLFHIHGAWVRLLRVPQAHVEVRRLRCRFEGDIARRALFVSHEFHRFRTSLVHGFRGHARHGDHPCLWTGDIVRGGDASLRMLQFRFHSRQKAR